MFGQIKKFFREIYNRYELETCVYMFEPWEKKMINGIVLIILCLITFSSYVYLPKYMETLLKFLSPAPQIGDIHVQHPQLMPVHH